MIWALFGRRNGGGRLASARRAFTAPDGRTWDVEVRLPSASNAMLVFHHPDTRSTAGNRYAWHQSAEPESRDVQARLAPQAVLDRLADADLGRLFRRSMPIASRVPRLEPAVGSADSWQLSIEAAADDVRRR